MNWNTYDYQIGAHYLSALINGDYSGLSDEEELELDGWLDSLDHGPGHWDCGDDYDEFAVDDVTGLRGAVITCCYYERG